MEQDKNKKQDKKTFINTSVDLICGSAAKVIFPVYLNQCLHTGISRETLIKPIIFDFDTQSSHKLVNSTLQLGLL